MVPTAAAAWLLAAGPALAQVTQGASYQASAGPVASLNQARWLDFSPLDFDPIESPSGQNYEFSIDPGSAVKATLELNLRQSNDNLGSVGPLSAEALPVDPVNGLRGSALGSVPILYQPDLPTRKPALVGRGGDMGLVLSNIVLRNAAGHSLQFDWVAADAGETVPLSDDRSEAITFTTDGGGWASGVQFTPINGSKPSTVRAALSDANKTLKITSILQDRANPAQPLSPDDYAAGAWVHTSRNPGKITAVMESGPGNDQAVVFAIIAQIPSASVTCAPSPLAGGESATCTVSVTNPPLSAYTLPLGFSGDTAGFDTSACASVAFAALQAQAQCVVTARRGSAAGAVDVAVTTDPLQPSWLVTGSPARVASTGRDVPVATVKEPAPVPTLGEWALMALGLLIGSLGLARLRKG